MSKEQDNATHSLAHTKWNCKYHIVFAPKYRRKVFYLEKREAIREILRMLCQWRNLSGSYPYVGKYPTQNERFGFHGISERKEQPDDIPAIWEYEVCVPKPRILV